MDTHKNARLTPKGREEMVRAVVDRGMSNAAGARQFNTTPENRRQMGRSLLCRRRGWLARSVLKTPFIAEPNPACHSRCHRKVAP
jgi:transposase-like protein